MTALSDVLCCCLYYLLKLAWGQTRASARLLPQEILLLRVPLFTLYQVVRLVLLTVLSLELVGRTHLEELLLRSLPIHLHRRVHYVLVLHLPQIHLLRTQH